MDDLVIRDAHIVDGTGGAPFTGDIAATAGVLTQVGGKAGRGRREIRADGCIATPGFIDIHTHYDAQINWDPYLSSSSSNGVTTVVMGNCGVGFAPAKPEAHESLIELMSVIEELPTSTLHAGIAWDWETFPEFMNALERRKVAIDYGVQIPHGAVRTYVMGRRGMDNEPAGDDDLHGMELLVREAMEAGALGLTGSRTPTSLAAGGKDAPGFRLPFEEMIRLGRAAGRSGHNGVIGLNVFFEDMDGEFEWLKNIRDAAAGLPVWFLLSQQHFQAQKFPLLLQKLEEAAAQGRPVYGQHAGRPVNYLLGLMNARNPLFERPSYQQIAALPLAQRVARLRDPAFRERLLAEKSNYRTTFTRAQAEAFGRMFRLGDPPDYEPPPEKSIASMAQATGQAPDAIALDMMLENDGQGLILSPQTNYLSGDASVVLDLFRNPYTVIGLGDGGAHATSISDASVPTFMLTHWARDRKRGPKLPLPEAVRKITSAGAAFFGIRDRGVLAPGKKADINVIDFDRLTLHAPEMVADLPAGGHRLIQRADGYVATFVSGNAIFENGKPTGEMPGKLVRSQARHEVSRS